MAQGVDLTPMARAQRFQRNSTQFRYPMAAITRPTGGGPSPVVTLPRVGFLARLDLAIRGSVAGTLSAPNALGMASIVSNFTLQANAGVQIASMSGAAYHYGVREVIESEYIDPNGQSNARSAVTATTFNLDITLPISVNMRDPIGLINLQDVGATIQFVITWLADASVATGATVTATCTPYLTLYTVPPDEDNWPDLSIVQTWIEDSRAVGGAGIVTYDWLLGQQYLQILHMLGVGASGSDLWSLYQLRSQQNVFPLQYDVAGMDIEYRYYRGRARVAGLIPIDRLATSGLGNYGTVRDVFDSAKSTDAASLITATGAGTLITVRRGLSVLKPPQLAA